MTSPTYLGATGAPAAPLASPPVDDGSFGETYLVEPEGFRLRLADRDRSMFSQMLGLVKEALDLGLTSNEEPVTIADANGTPHQVTTLRFRQIMVGYGSFYKALWDHHVNPPQPA